MIFPERWAKLRSRSRISWGFPSGGRGVQQPFVGVWAALLIASTIGLGLQEGHLLLRCGLGEGKVGGTQPAPVLEQLDLAFQGLDAPEGLGLGSSDPSQAAPALLGGEERLPESLKGANTRPRL